MEKKEKVKTFEEACTVSCLDPATVLPYPEPKTDLEKALNAAAKLYIIVNAINGDWRGDFTDRNQYKYYPWFYMNAERVGSGLGFSFDDYVCGHSCTAVGSRLCFRSRELAKYAATQFQAEYNEYLML